MVRMRDYLFGLATIPALAATGAGLFYGGRALATWSGKVFRALPQSTARQRALFAAAAASSRRVHVFGFGAATVVVTLGYDPAGSQPIYDAVYKVIGPKATINPKRLRRGAPTEPRVDHSDDGDDQPEPDTGSKAGDV